MSIKIVLQTDYPNIAYRDKNGKPSGATIASGGCGCAAWVNALNNLLDKNLSLTSVCKLATQSGARYNGGTDVFALGKALLAKYGGFELHKTTSDDEVIRAVRDKGAVAVCHTSGSYPLFSNGGHFVCMIDITDVSKATILDSYWYPGKWQVNSIRQKAITTTEHKGIVKCGTSHLRKAFDYYIIVKKAKIKQNYDKWDARDDDYKSGVDVVVTAENGVKLREGAGTDKKAIRTLQRGAKGRGFGAYSTGDGDNDLWWLVTFDGVKGYVNADWVGFV